MLHFIFNTHVITDKRQKQEQDETGLFFFVALLSILFSHDKLRVCVHCCQQTAKFNQ